MPDIKLNLTCYFDVSLLASELNYFLLDIKTILQALACFYKAFLLNLRPQPSGHITKSVSFSGCYLDYSISYYLIIGFSSCGFINSYFLTGYYFFYICFTETGSSFLYYFLCSYFDAYFWIIILFWGAFGGGSTTVFFSIIWGESFKTNLSPADFSYWPNFCCESRFVWVDRRSS